MWNSPPRQAWPSSWIAVFMCRWALLGTTGRDALRQFQPRLNLLYYLRFRLFFLGDLGGYPGKRNVLTVCQKQSRRDDRHKADKPQHDAATGGHFLGDREPFVRIKHADHRKLRATTDCRQLNQ